jgi:FixJ family two-component response regulator
VIVVTGYPDGDLMMRAMRHSPLLVLAKPFDLGQALDAIDLALNGAKSKRASLGKAGA